MEPLKCKFQNRDIVPQPIKGRNRIREANKVLNGKKTYNTWQQGFLQIFNAVSDNKQIVMNIYHSVNREQIEIYLYKLTYDLLIGVIEENAAGLEVRDDDKKFIADFYKYAFVGLILDWIKNGTFPFPAHQWSNNRQSYRRHGLHQADP